MARLEGAYDQVSQRLMTLDPRLDSFDRKIDLRFDMLDKKIDAIDKKFDARFDVLDKKIDQKFYWMIGIFIPTWIATIGLYFRH
jgi:hypothetical protein